MYATSERWDKALRTSGTIVSRVEVWRGGEFTGRTLSLLAGSVRVDGTSRVRRALSMLSDETDLMPDDASDELNPIDTDLKVFTGVTYTEGDTEWVPVFTGRIMEPSRAGWTEALAITADDYSTCLADARFTQPFNITASPRRRAHEVIAEMVNDVLPWVTVINLTGTEPVVQPVSFARDRVEALTALADMCNGASWWFTPDGDFIIGQVPTTPAADPDWEIDAGTPTSVLTGSGESLSSRGIYNAVTAISSPANGSPVSVTAYQSTGPLAYRDGFQRPLFWETNIAMTREMLYAAAKRRLSQSLQLASRVPATCAPNPALEVGDTVGVVKPSGVRTLQVVSGFTVPLTVGDMGSAGMDVSLSANTETTGDVSAEGVS